MNTIERMCVEAKRKLKHSINTSAGMHKLAIRNAFKKMRKEHVGGVESAPKNIEALKCTQS